MRAMARIAVASTTSVMKKTASLLIGGCLTPSAASAS